MKTLLNTIKELQDEWHFHTFEHGVEWLNEHEAMVFGEKYPRLVMAINAVIAEAQKAEEW